MDFHDPEATLEQRLASINLKIEGSFTKTKDKHNLRCLVCDTITSSTIHSRVQTFKKNGTNGCPVCKSNNLYSENRESFKKQIEDSGYNILTPNYNGKQDGSILIHVLRVDCGHDFHISPTNLIHRRVICPVCNKGGF